MSGLLTFDMFQPGLNESVVRGYVQELKEIADHALFEIKMDGEYFDLTLDIYEEKKAYLKTIIEEIKQSHYKLVVEHNIFIDKQSKIVWEVCGEEFSILQALRFTKEIDNRNTKMFEQLNKARHEIEEMDSFEKLTSASYAKYKERFVVLLPELVANNVEVSNLTIKQHLHPKSHKHDRLYKSYTEDVVYMKTFIEKAENWVENAEEDVKHTEKSLHSLPKVNLATFRDQLEYLGINEMLETSEVFYKTWTEFINVIKQKGCELYAAEVVMKGAMFNDRVDDLRKIKTPCLDDELEGRINYVTNKGLSVISIIKKAKVESENILKKIVDEETVLKRST